MDDRTLLELAAKAAGLVNASYFAGTDKYKEGVWFDYEFGRACFNPLTDDGDALRLAVKLRLEIDIHHTGIAVRTPTGVKILIYAEDNPDACAATRRAIVRAAAAIGESK